MHTSLVSNPSGSTYPAAPSPRAVQLNGCTAENHCSAWLECQNKYVCSMFDIRPKLLYSEKKPKTTKLEADCGEKKSKKLNIGTEVVPQNPL